MTDSMTSLDALCQLCGIVDSYLDARKVVRTTTRETRQALLAAMGIAASDEESAAVALAELQKQQLDQPLPPVHVHYQTAGPLELEVNGDSSEPLQWQIELESGAITRGCAPALAATETEVARRRVLRIDEPLPCGYHTLSLPTANSRCSLIVTPGTCWLPSVGRQLWGVTVQLYLLRSASNWGIGDYTDLKLLVELLAARGADVVGLNPLHAMFPDDPEQASPYSPASRLLLNVLNIDVATVANSIVCGAAHEQMRTPDFQESLTHSRQATLLDYSRVAALKMPVLQQLFGCCDRSAPDWQDFVQFRADAGPVFERGCLFLALRRHFAGDSAAMADWHQWPAAYRKADSPAVEQYAQSQAESVTFQAWLQFIADRQLRTCHEASAGMAVGLYRDLAVGASRGGAETWANPDAVVDIVEVGAPPDIYNPQGQGWGLPPFNPRALRAEGYRSFIDLLRANMRHAGGLRIDHVMALQQLYWVPQGKSPADGGYVRYPLADLVGILALESQRNECLVVGEDLGTVPDGFRECMERAQVLSYRVLFFEKDEQNYIAPECYPQLALAVAGSHDLPTLRAWWEGKDLTLKARLGLYPTEKDATQAGEDRLADRAALDQRLQHSRVTESSCLTTEQFVDAAHRFLARTASMVRMLQIDDLTGEIDPVNVPGTSQEHPNWRRRLALSVEELPGDPRFITATTAIAAAAE
jgi:4-alpha-glucanotransferase